MKRYIALWLAVFSLCLTAAELKGKCTKVSDGDTITVQEAGKDGGTFRIRLALIDAPEKAQPFGKEAAAWLSLLLLNRDVVVTFREIDHYGRIIGRVSCDGDDASMKMLRGGYAWHYAYFNNDPEAAKAQKAAKESKLGLWADDDPVPPWEYRQSR